MPLATLLVLCSAAAASAASAAAAAPPATPPLVGGAKALPAEELLSPDVLAAAQQVLYEVERGASRTQQPSLLAVTRVLAASRQVVAGVLWKLEVEMAPTSCPRTIAEVGLDPVAEVRDRCRPTESFSRVFEASALHRAWIKDAPWTVTVTRMREPGKQWVKHERTAAPTVSPAERERRKAEDAEAAAEQAAADRRREAIAAQMRAHADEHPEEEQEIE
jgi:hypothetical protein